MSDTGRTPEADAARHRDYLIALRASGIADADALAMTVAYIQAEAMRDEPSFPLPPAPPRPEIVR